MPRISALGPLLPGLLAWILLLASPLALAEDKAPNDEPAIYLQLIKRMQQQGSWFASLAHIQAYRQQHGDSAGLQLVQADALRQTGQSSQAAQIYQRINRGELASQASHGLGLIAMADGDKAQSIQYLQRAAALSPLRADYLGDLGYAYLLAGDIGAARAPLAQAAELDPGDGRAVANLALWQILDGNRSAALQMMSKAQLPQATQTAVQEQAAEISRQYRQPTPPAISAAPSASTAPLLATHATPAAASSVQPPGSMLERFAPLISADQGNTP